jgi:hypothetical protein
MKPDCNFYQHFRVVKYIVKRTLKDSFSQNVLKFECWKCFGSPLKGKQIVARTPNTDKNNGDNKGVGGGGGSSDSH